MVLHHICPLVLHTDVLSSVFPYIIYLTYTEVMEMQTSRMYFTADQMLILLK